MFNITEFLIIIPFLIDRWIGDPEFRYHPVRFIGISASWLEKVLNTGNVRRFKGLLFTLEIVIFWYLLFYILDKYLKDYQVFYIGYQIIFIYFGISSYELSKRILKIDDLIEKDIEMARQKLSLIVGRDTEKLDPQGIRRALVETVSENFNDGFVAPLFYYILGGLPLLYFYKVVNTLDSMVGYKNERFGEFGFFSAKLDDVVNFIPARLTVLIIYLASLEKDVLLYAIKYGGNHSSPNSGYPEAAISGVIKCRLGGPNFYGGVLVEKPYIGEADKEITRSDIIKSVKIISISSYITIIICLAVLIL